MDKLKTFLKLLCKKYNNRTGQNLSDCYTVLGTGNYAIVFDMEGMAYKITAELNYKKQHKLAIDLNNLHNMGVNVPYTYCVHCYNDSKDFLKTVKDSAQKNNYDDFIADIQQILSNTQTKNIDNTSDFCGIIQQKIQGDAPFNSVPTHIVDALLLTQEQVEYVLNDATDTTSKARQYINKIQADLNQKLDYFLQIPTNHYAKFITDALVIYKNKISIDNVTRKNYIYNPNNGFYFLDLGAFQHIDFTPYKKPNITFSYTIENVLSQVAYPLYYFDETTKQKYIQLFAKMYEALSTAYLNNIQDEFITTQIKKYVNLTKQDGYNKAYNSFVKTLPKQQISPYVSKVNYTKSIIKGNALTCGE